MQSSAIFSALGITHIDLVLARAHLVVGVFGVDPELLQGEDGLPAQI